MKAHQLLTITRLLKGVQLDQLVSLIQGSDDPDDYNPNALRQIEEALSIIHGNGLMDTEDFREIMHLSSQMRGVVE